jgi:integrase
LGALLRALEGFEGTFVVSCALRLTPLLFVRPGELRHMEWGEVDREAGLWTIPGEKMKMDRDHSVPLAHQTLITLNELEPLTGGERYVFPANRGRGRPMSENTVNAALRRLGYSKDEVTAHGFRATARTLLDEVLGERPDIIEHQLAHAVRDPNGRAYNRTAHLPERRQMMQRWADYLDSLRTGATVVPLRVRM